MKKRFLALLLLAASPALAADPDKCPRQDDDHLLRIAVESSVFVRASSKAVIDLLERENAALKADLADARTRLRDLEAK